VACVVPEDRHFGIRRLHCVDALVVCILIGRAQKPFF
jgi:hypothetical protein